MTDKTETGGFAEERIWYHFTEVEKIDRERRTHKRALRDLIKACEEVVKAMDIIGKWPASHEKGKRFAKIANFLEQAKDSAKLFGGLRRPSTKKHTHHHHERSAKRQRSGAQPELAGD